MIEPEKLPAVNAQVEPIREAKPQGRICYDCSSYLPPTCLTKSTCAVESSSFPKPCVQYKWKYKLDSPNT